MNDLEIVVNHKLGVLTTNISDIEAALTDQMEVYKALEVTEQNKPERKKDIATLRKMEKSIDAKKSEVRLKCLAPYDEFVGQADKLKLLIAEPIRIINNQIIEFDDKQRLEKIAKINVIFNDLACELLNEIGIAEVYDTRWENIAVSMKSIKDEMTIKLDDIRNNAKLIDNMVSDIKDEALSLFWGDLDVNKAISMINTYERQKREIEAQLIERQRKEKEAEEEREKISKERELERERERVRAEERAKIRNEEIQREAILSEERKKAAIEEERIRSESLAQARQEQADKEKAEHEAMKIKKQETVSSLETNVLSITGTEEELNQINMYLDSLGVDWEKVC